MFIQRNINKRILMVDLRSKNVPKLSIHKVVAELTNNFETNLKDLECFEEEIK
jgi:hypothetical protein